MPLNIRSIAGNSMLKCVRTESPERINSHMEKTARDWTMKHKPVLNEHVQRSLLLHEH